MNTETIELKSSVNGAEDKAGLAASGGSTIYEIANPSDAYTMKCDNFHVAAVAVAILGNGAYGIEGTPVLFGWDDWLTAQKINLDTFIPEHREQIALALESVLIGSKGDREEVEATLKRILPGQREAWLAERHDKRRSSMNDIGAKAQRMAQALRAKL